MQKGKFLFLVFLLASAVILGSTIGLISNVSYIVNRTDILQPEKADPSGHDEKENNHQKSTVPSPGNHTQDNSSIENNGTPTVNTSNASTNSKSMVISEDEKNQIISMLVSLGMTEKDSLNDFIRQFQTKHALNPTGNLDSSTIDTIIEQTTLQQVTINLQRSLNY